MISVVVIPDDTIVLREMRSDVRNRWITSREALLCQGFPILTGFSFGVPVCSFATEGHDWDLADSTEWTEAEANTDRTARMGQAGNAMHTQCVGIVLAHVLSSGNRSLLQLQHENATRLTSSGSQNSTPLAPGLMRMAAMVMGTPRTSRLAKST